jgi:hypothetical protein
MVQRVIAVSALVLGIGAGPAAAQVDPIGVGQGAVLSTTMRAHSSRVATRGSSSDSSGPTYAKICGSGLPKFRRKYGASHPEVRKLAATCAQIRAARNRN